MSQKRKVTMQDIADRLGVTKVTVSKALNDKEGVSDDLKEKIRETAEKLGYKYNFMGKGLKSNLSYNIGVIVSEIFFGKEDVFYPYMYKTLCQTLEEFKYTNTLHVLTLENEKNNVLPTMMSQQKIDGLIVMGQISNSYIELLTNQDIELILLDFYSNDHRIDSVLTDNFFGCHEMTNYLIKKGYKNIAYVGNIYATVSIQDRFLGYYKSLIEHRIPFNDSYLINDRNEKGELIDIKLPEKFPEAFVCNCDRTANRLINQLKRLGYSIPKDCAIVGFDNDSFSTISDPKLTTYEVDIPKMVKTAVEFLTKKIVSPREYGRILVKGGLIERDSVLVKYMTSKDE